MKKLLLLASLCAPLLALAGEAGTALKADSVRAEPFADAKTTGSLNKGDSVDILAKKGAWLQIKSKKNTGWVRLLSVKRGGASGGNSAAGVFDVASGRAGTGKVVSTTGIRGLSAEELKAAKFSEDEMKKMESYSQSASGGEQFAKVGGLSKANLAYFKGVK
ncbi:MAG: SH3 domain-containing protein [Methylophilaceae bacterium]